tara:strand:- start:174 stop:383 length:210 start_codon:yes stop_codon:yes gene_type:complete
MQNLINEIDKLETIKQSIRLIKGNQFLVENLLDMINPIIRDKESLVEDGIANLHEEEALRIHEAEKGVA